MDKMDIEMEERRWSEDNGDCILRNNRHSKCYQLDKDWPIIRTYICCVRNNWNKKKILHMDLVYMPRLSDNSDM